jgi:hypothetical protein
MNPEIHRKEYNVVLSRVQKNLRRNYLGRRVGMGFVTIVHALKMHFWKGQVLGLQRWRLMRKHELGVCSSINEFIHWENEVILILNPEGSSFPVFKPDKWKQNMALLGWGVTKY